MSGNPLNILKPVLIAAAMGAGLISCSQADRMPDSLFSSPAMRVTPDSIFIASGATAAPATLPVVPQHMPVLSSPSPLLDYAFAQAMIQCDSLLNADSAQVTPLRNLEIWQTLSLLDPERSMKLLTAQVADSIVDFNMPLTAEYGLWTVAAHATALSSGNLAWLRYAHDIAGRTFKYNEQVCRRADTGLLQGMPFLSKPVAGTIPRWMEETDRFECMTTLANTMAAGAARSLADMALVLADADTTAWLGKTSEMSDAINLYLWQPHLRRYGQYLYTGLFPIASEISDNAAQALAIIFSVPTREMALGILQSTPMLNYGMPMFYPSPGGTPPQTPRTVSPEMQALWTLAAARYPDESAVAAPLGVLLSSSFIGDNTSISRRMAAMTVLRVLAGINVSHTAMTFRPVVPRILRSGFTIERLRWRDATISLKITGYGDKIARFAIDGAESTEYSLSNSLHGHHTVEITLANNSISNNADLLKNQIWSPAVPEIEWSAKAAGTITDATPGVHYIEYVNGAQFIRLDSSMIAVPQRTSYSRLCIVPVSDGNNAGLAAKPHSFYPATFARTLQAEDFAPASSPLVHERRMSRRFVESSAKSNRTVSFTTTVAETSLYSVALCYSNGSGSAPDGSACGVRRLLVNGVDSGTLVMPGKGKGWWLATDMSNTLAVQLRRGENEITVEYDAALYPPGSDAHTLLYDYLQIIRLR
jgi:hypothetical protein